MNPQRNIIAPKIVSYPPPFCPDCGAQMALNPPPDVFWGCPEFPVCTGSREIGEDSKPTYDEIAPEMSDVEMAE
jgi:hypothetical protein